MGIKKTVTVAFVIVKDHSGGNMRQVIQIIYGLTFLLSLTFTFNAQAATITYVSGDLHAAVTNRHPGGEDTDDDVGFPSVIAGLGYSNPEEMVGNSRAYANIKINPSSIDLSFDGDGEIMGSTGPWYMGSTAATSGFIYFKVESTPDDNINSGNLYLDYSFRSKKSIIAETDSFYIITINGNVVLNKFWSRSYFPFPDSMSESFDVEIGDMIGIRASIGGSCDGGPSGGYYSSALTSSISVDKAFVPLPSALLLLGAGLFRLAAYKRRKSASRS